MIITVTINTENKTIEAGGWDEFNDLESVVIDYSKCKNKEKITIGEIIKDFEED